MEKMQLFGCVRWDGSDVSCPDSLGMSDLYGHAETRLAGAMAFFLKRST